MTGIGIPTAQRRMLFIGRGPLVVTELQRGWRWGGSIGGYRTRAITGKILKILCLSNFVRDILRNWRGVRCWAVRNECAHYPGVWQEPRMPNWSRQQVIGAGAVHGCSGRCGLCNAVAIDKGAVRGGVARVSRLYLRVHRVTARGMVEPERAGGVRHGGYGD